MTAKPVRVAVVTPTYNSVRFLRETIDSVLSQDYPHVDYLVVDGGSSDGTLELLRSYEGRVRYISEPDLGQGDAINKGFERTNGEIFAFLNADDTYLPGAVGTAVGRLANLPDAGAIYGQAWHTDEDGRRLSLYPTRPFDAGRLAADCFICQPACFMRRGAFEAVGTMDASLHWALDYELWMRFSDRGRMVMVDDVLATSRMHADTKTLGSRREIYEEIIKVVKAHHDYVPLAWLWGYACYLCDPHADQFFAAPRQGPLQAALALALGVRHNPRQPIRYARDWARAVRTRVALASFDDTAR